MSKDKEITLRGYQFHENYDGIQDGLLLAELDDIVQLISKEELTEWVKSSPEKDQFRKICRELSGRLCKPDQAELAFFLGDRFRRPVTESEKKYIQRWVDMGVKFQTVERACEMSMKSNGAIILPYVDAAIKKLME